MTAAVQRQSPHKRAKQQKTEGFSDHPTPQRQSTRLRRYTRATEKPVGEADLDLEGGLQGTTGFVSYPTPSSPFEPGKQPGWRGGSSQGGVRTALLTGQVIQLLGANRAGACQGRLVKRAPFTIRGGSDWTRFPECQAVNRLGLFGTERDDPRSASGSRSPGFDYNRIKPDPPADEEDRLLNTETQTD
ncbi:unnamed protein product [Lota lota]